ncbi:hypothetical protein A2398_00280 [Candidatus Peribacteria bacterium RIFOXYB1_FULL_57_12]|nr:MAG: hypothetical protein A2398_00280 [Candidatus Peribacteria bacterium RIFOXYB1_FULL_57_12]
MCLCLLARAELARRFDHHIHLEVFPGTFGRIFFPNHADGFSFDAQVFALYLHGTVTSAMERVVLEQVLAHRRITRCIDRNNFHFLWEPREELAVDDPSDASVSINGYSQHG